MHLGGSMGCVVSFILPINYVTIKSITIGYTLSHWIRIGYPSPVGKDKSEKVPTSSKYFQSLPITSHKPNSDGTPTVSYQQIY